jgi:NAD(P)-dependent dehydrogenase (short-subunit alcohol dehydrogenase family)
MMDLRGGSALVTGGAGGIGIAVARRLVAAGAATVLADIDADRGPSLAADVDAEFFRTDVTVADDLVAAVAAAEARGPLRLVHLNAGVTTVGSIEDLDMARYRRAVGVNVDGVFWGIRAAIPALRRSGGGAVVATASLAGLVPVPVDPVYSMTKSAVVALVRSVGPLLRSEGIRLNCICPGFVDTPMVPESLRVDGFPLLSAAEVADAVIAIATGESDSEAYALQPGLDLIRYRFRGVPGARTQGPDGGTTMSALGIVGLEPST